MSQATFGTEHGEGLHGQITSALGYAKNGAWLAIKDADIDRSKDAGRHDEVALRRLVGALIDGSGDRRRDASGATRSAARAMVVAGAELLQSALAIEAPQRCRRR